MANPSSSWHRLRKKIHLICFLVFLALPFLDVIRADIPRQRFYFFGNELWINEFAIIFFAMMFLMFLVIASSVLYGRVYCGYMCPQMIFSEASVAVERWINRWASRKSIGRKSARVLFYAVIAVASVFLAFIFIAYFVEPRDLLRRLASLDIHTAAGISGAAVTILTFLDFSLVRQKFCTTVCPYGYLQGMLGDGNTLLVHYRDDTHECIECKKCVRICPMGIDIRESPFQIECIHCGECIDACDEILARLHKPGLIHYTWGEKGERLNDPSPRPWYRRIGLRDAKRVVVLLVLACYATALSVAFAMRHAVLVQISPIRATLYRVDSTGRVFNRFRYSVSNRGHNAAAVILSIQHLPGATLSLAPNPVPVQPGETVQGEFDISTPPNSRSDLVSHFTIETSTVPDQARETFPMTFLAPSERQAP